MKSYVFFSAYFKEKETVAASRIYGLTKSLKTLGNEIVLCSPNVNFGNVSDDYFIDKFIYLPTEENPFLEKIRKVYKKNRIYEERNSERNSFRPYENVRSLIDNNILWYDHFYSPSRNQYFQVKYSSKLIKQIALQFSNSNPILVTSSGPSIMNYFGYKVKKKNPNIFWVADYRDLNQNNPYKSDKFNFKGKKMDKLVFKYADLITTVSYGAKEQNIENARKMGYDIRDRTYVLYNGYSKDEVSGISSFELSKKYKDILSSLKIKIIFTGTIYPLRRIDLFFEALREVDNALFVYAGGSYDLVDYYRNKLKIESKVINLKVISKEEAEFLQRNSDILLQLKADVKEDGILTGKFFEYLQKNKRILSLGDKDEEYNEICKSLKNVDILPYDKGRIAEYINSLKLEDLKENYDPNIERFSWEILAKEFDDFISQKLIERKSTA